MARKLLILASREPIPDRLLAQHRRTAVEDRVRLGHRITALLKSYFPQALDWAGALDTIQACDFLLRWSTLPVVQKVRPQTLRKFLLQPSVPQPATD